ncbi:sulfatase-like hydrolase/transferase [Coraliomargarita sp. SDUM461003]|uniref:Sulfatase-like hydrolase/transferase n=1 Tax=Thalassobacterium maritimum TaxID=3041265 RepID=A0ABU1APS2_9BACT|nr:sulfatase-like hydrolase/transferase [Coraliomargarita sp. SDUM461003]MDQ8206106.1 sulfatase-like hydrolase/transferase [Coraliomargarita sp. SDUM461003]
MPPNTKKPNVLFILADDMGAWAMACAGNSEVRTPNLDRIAARGMRMENAFCVSPVCSPARASLLTGMIPSQHGVHDWICRGNSPSESSDGAIIDYLDSRETYTEILARNGYECALSGKWHLGNAVELHSGHHYWRVHARGGGPYYNAPMIREGAEIHEPAYVTNVITEHALEFLAVRDTQKPFYLGVHYTAPHSPWEREEHPPEFFDPYFNDCAFDSVPDLPMHPWQINTATFGSTPEKRRELLSGYYAAITAMDSDVGRILDRLEQQQLLENTLIVFTSDNGMNMGHHGIYGKGNGTYPQNMYDSSVKVPFLVAHGDRIGQGRAQAALFSHYDFMPTLLDYLGLESDTPADLPGRSRLNLWSGGTEVQDAPLFVFDEYGAVQMIRTSSWKYVHRYQKGPNELYDLCQDPDETSNLLEPAASHPMAEELRVQMQAWFENYADEALDGRKLKVYGRGQREDLRLSADDWFKSDYVYLSKGS